MATKRGHRSQSPRRPTTLFGRPPPRAHSRQQHSRDEAGHYRHHQGRRHHHHEHHHRHGHGHGHTHGHQHHHQDHARPGSKWAQFADEGEDYHQRAWREPHSPRAWSGPGSPRVQYPQAWEHRAHDHLHSPRLAPTSPSLHIPPGSPVLAPHSPRYSYGLTDHGIVSAGPLYPALSSDVVTHSLPVHLGSPRLVYADPPLLTGVSHGPFPISGAAQSAAAATSDVLALHGFDLPQPVFGGFTGLSTVPASATTTFEVKHTIPVRSGFHVAPVNPAAVPEVLISVPSFQPRSPSPTASLSLVPPGVTSFSPGIYDGRRASVVFY